MNGVLSSGGTRKAFGFYLQWTDVENMMCVYWTAFIRNQNKQEGKQQK